MTEHTDDVLIDLIGRMETAEARLIDIAEAHGPLSDERKRCTAKANGVALARSYVTEALRRFQEAIKHG